MSGVLYMVRNRMIEDDFGTELSEESVSEADGKRRQGRVESKRASIVGEGTPRPGSVKERNGPMKARRHRGRLFEERRWGLRLLSSGEYMVLCLQARERVCPQASLRPCSQSPPLG